MVLGNVKGVIKVVKPAKVKLPPAPVPAPVSRVTTQPLVEAK